ncbi:MAG: putative LPS assembly protein LptD [Salinibacter sp.]|uniref:putative LPS assembly protein LptD n=1 Tax=Salinibacter sp. TaxID=2065818 RepID=UPI0035D4C0D5
MSRSRFVYRLLIGLGLVPLVLLLASPSAAQKQGQAADTVRRPSPDSLQRPPPGQSAPPTAAQQGPPSSRKSSAPGSSGAGVKFSASDSLVIVMRPDSNNRGALYGKARVSYQKASLKGGTITMNLGTSVVQATGPPSDTAAQGRPVFSRGQGTGGQSAGRQGPGGQGLGGQGQSFTGKKISFNLRTKRGRVVAARTQRRNGYVQGEAVKVFEDSTVFVRDGSYTTCNCPPDQIPSYSLRSGKMKVEGRWVYTGPIQLYLFDIPTPLWLPFGVVPNVPGRRSGPLSPRYGQDRRKGFYLQDLGWYFALNDYTDLQIRASVWSKGSYEINPVFRYRKRYAYDGQLNVTYQRTRIGERGDPNFINKHQGRLRWSHSQELSPTASIRGDINLVTSSNFARQSPNSYDEAVSQEITSDLSYSKNWPGGGQNLSVSANQNQQLQTGEVRMTLPDVNFSQRSFKPFDLEQAVGEERWFEKITTSYEFRLNNRYSFQPRAPRLRERASTLRSRGDSTRADSLVQVADSLAEIAWYEALVDRRKYQAATGNDKAFDFEATHRIPLNASFRINRYNLSLSPNIRYTSDWRINTKRRFVRRDSIPVSEDSVRIDEETIERTVRGFYARRSFSTGISANTQVFGTFPLRIGPLQGLRHRMNPSLSFRYTPNFNAPFWGRTRRLRYENGDPVLDEQTGEPVRYDILNGRRVRGSNEQRSLSFSLDNELETKYVQVDSTGEQQEEKIKLLDFDLGASYNFAADNFKTSDIDFRARTTIKDFRISTDMTFSPYALRPRSTQRSGTDGAGESGPQLPSSPTQADPDSPVQFTRVDRYMVAESPLTPVRLTRFRIDVGGSFQSQRQGGRTGTRRGGTRRGQRPGSGRPGQTQRGPQRPQRPGTDQPSSSTSSPSTSNGYLDARLPWSLNFDFSYSFRKPEKRIENQRATLGAQFTLDVTPLWSLQGRTGFDLIDSELSTTRINIQRDLGCWSMSFSWVPFGRYQSYSFNLQVDSGRLSQLLRLQIPNSGRGGRLGGFGQRLRQTAGGLTRGVGGSPTRGRRGPGPGR